MAESPEVVDLAAEAAAKGDGVHWALRRSSDLNANLVWLDGDHTIAEHVNDALDVLVIGQEGSGWLVIDGDPHRLRPGVVALVPKGARRAVQAGTTGVSYLTVHRRRGPLTIGPARS